MISLLLNFINELKRNVDLYSEKTKVWPDEEMWGKARKIEAEIVLRRIEEILGSFQAER